MNAYYMIGAATSITAVTSVWNQLIIKGFEVPVHAELDHVRLRLGHRHHVVRASAMSARDRGAHGGGGSGGGGGGGGGGGTTQRLRGSRGGGAAAHWFFEGYTTLAILLVLFQAFHGLAVALVYKYADAIVKNFANSSVMAILIVVSFYFFNLQTTVHSWLGIIIVLTTTYCYMNIALQLPTQVESKPAEKTHLLEEGTHTEGEGDDPPTPAAGSRT